MTDKEFQKRYWEKEDLRPCDERNEYQRDKARVIHSSAFRRLQGKTQVMGVGEGDFHRTRLTHSIETAQVGEGLLGSLKLRNPNDSIMKEWLPSRDLLTGACLAHDLGHPPFGHAGEKALYRRMVDYGGFEGNAQTLRIVTRLEKYKPQKGMNPTRRFILAVLKYPSPYSAFDKEKYPDKPPKCYYDSEAKIVEWALGGAGFPEGEVHTFIEERKSDGKPMHRTFDCSIMEYADDIAYAVHDLEDIVARKMVSREEMLEELRPTFCEYGKRIGPDERAVSLTDFEHKLFSKEHFERKGLIGKLVHLFVTSAKVKKKDEFEHPLLKMRIDFDEPVKELLKTLKNLTYKLVVGRAAVQQIEHRGVRIVDQLFSEIIKDPKKLIPTSNWNSYRKQDSDKRKVCDYIAGMTDPYAEKIYGRFFIPGVGSSHDEL